MIALYLTGTVLLALGLYWLGVNHGRDFQTKRLGQYVLLAGPVLELLADGADEVVTSTRRDGDAWSATHMPIEKEGTRK